MGMPFGEMPVHDPEATDQMQPHTGQPDNCKEISCHKKNRAGLVLGTTSASIVRVYFAISSAGCFLSAWSSL
jgi:hypothetical protein